MEKFVNRVLKYVSDKNAILLIFIVTFITFGNSLKFYFWHDDFSVFYSARIHQCLFEWPYLSYCKIFPFMERFLNFSPLKYYVIGIILISLASFAFYLFLKELVSTNIAIVIALIFATGYIGVDAYLEVYSSITTSLSIFTLFSSLRLVYRSLNSNKIADMNFIYGLVFFVFSIISLRARSFSYIFVLLLLIVIYSNKLFSKVTISRIAFLTTVYLISYFTLSTKYYSIFGSSNLNNYIGSESFSEIARLVKVFGSFVITEYIEKSFFVNLNDNLQTALLIAGALVVVFALYFTYISLKLNKNIFKIRVFSIGYLLFVLSPYFIKTGWVLSSSDRYLIFVFPGVLMFLYSFYKNKFMKYLLLLILGWGIFNSYTIVSAHGKLSVKRADFYKQLMTLRPEIGGNSIFYFVAKQSEQNNIADFFRTGMFPPETSLATHYKVDYKTITLITDSASFPESMDDESVRNLYSFYYDGDKLTDTTQEVRSILSNLDQKLKFSMQPITYTQKTKPDIWFDYTSSAEFKPLIPFRIEIQAVSKINLDGSSIVLTSDGIGEMTDSLYLHNLPILTQIRNIKSDIKNIDTNNVGINSEKFMIDDNPFTIWAMDQKKWREKQELVISVNLSKQNTISGLIINSGAKLHLPENIEVFSNEVPVSDLTIQSDSAYTFVDFDKTESNKLKIKITGTKLGSEPWISELEILPTPHLENKGTLDKLLYFSPKTNIQSKDYGILEKYLRVNTPVCLIWENDYGKGKIDFSIKSDGIARTYAVPIPALGIDNPKLSIGCINYPVEINVSKVMLKYNNFN